MKFTADVILLILSAVNNDIFFLFSTLQMWTMKLTESMNICYISDRVACTIKVNIKESFMKNCGFLQMDLYSTNLMDSCYSLPAFRKIEPMLTKIDFITFWNPSWLDICTFWLLVTLCGMAIGLQHNYKINVVV